VLHIYDAQYHKVYRLDMNGVTIVQFVIF